MDIIERANKFLEESGGSGSSVNEDSTVGGARERDPAQYKKSLKMGEGYFTDVARVIAAQKKIAPSKLATQLANMNFFYVLEDRGVVDEERPYPDQRSFLGSLKASIENAFDAVREGDLAPDPSEVKMFLLDELDAVL